MAARFWVGGAGDLSDASHIATTSGGAGGTALTSADTLTFDTNSGTGTVTVTAPTTLSAITLNKTGLTLQTSAALTVTTTLTVTLGTLNVGAALTAQSLSSAGSSTRSILLNASTVTLNGTTSPLNLAATGLTWNAGTSLIVFSGNGPGGIFTSGLAFYDVSIQNLGGASSQLTGANPTFRNLTITGGVSGSGSLLITGFTVTGLLTMTANSAVNRYLLGSTVKGTQRTVTAAAVAITNVGLQDIKFAGAAAPVSGTALGDAQGNAGVTFEDPLTLYRIGADGSWSDPTHWSLSPGGPNDAPRAPLPQDTAYIDASATGTISVDSSRLCRHLDLTGFAGTFSFTSTVFREVYGNLTLSSDPAFAFGGSQGVIVLSGRGSQQLVTAGKTITRPLRVDAPGGSYTLQDDLVCTAGLTHVSGLIDANNKPVTLSSFASTVNTARELRMGTQTWTLTGTGTIWNMTPNVAAVIDPSTSTIVIADTSATAKVFSGGGRTYRNLDITPGAGTVQLGGSTWASIKARAPMTLLFTAGTTTTFTAFDVQGEPGNLVAIESTASGSQATLSKASGYVIADYLTIRDSVATGGAQFYAGAHSTNRGNNSGWQFVAPSPGTDRMMAWFYRRGAEL